MLRFALFAVLVLPLAAAPASAGPRDELLRVAPADAALVVVIQNARAHADNLSQSPFAKWLPDTAVGKKFLGSDGLKQFTRLGEPVFAMLGTTPEVLLDDVLGDAVAFAYSPAPAGRPEQERAVLLVRPRKIEALEKLVAKLNDLQMQGGEVKKVEKREHAGEPYFARHTGAGAAHFYCFRGGVFAFSTSEADVKAVIDRDKAAPPVAKEVPGLVARMKELGVADALAVILVNPRALDAEVTAQVAAADPAAKRFLEKFAEVWKGLDSAALYLTLGEHAELGVSLRFTPDKLPADARKFLTGLRAPSVAGQLIPKDALFGVAGHFRAADLVDLVAALAPVEPGKPGVKEWLGQTVGPVVGRGNLPLVLEALGPNWAAWAVPPEKDALLPTAVAAVEIGGPGENRAKAEEAILDGLQTAFTLARLAYNGSHPIGDQITAVQEKDPATGALIRSLANEKGFPPGFRPSFAIQKGYLVLATHPDAIRRFDPPRPAKAEDYRTLARFSGTRSREYLRAQGAGLAKFLHGLGAGDENKIREQIADIADVLELIDSAELTARAGENTLRVALRVTAAKSLKKE